MTRAVAHRRILWICLASFRRHPHSSFMCASVTYWSIAEMVVIGPFACRESETVLIIYLSNWGSASLLHVSSLVPTEGWCRLTAVPRRTTYGGRCLACSWRWRKYCYRPVQRNCQVIISVLFGLLHLMQTLWTVLRLPECGFFRIRLGNYTDIENKRISHITFVGTLRTCFSS
jgi:hypothetical protein